MHPNTWKLKYSIMYQKGHIRQNNRKSNKQKIKTPHIITWASLPKGYSAEGGAILKTYINDKKKLFIKADSLCYAHVTKPGIRRPVPHTLPRHPGQAGSCCSRTRAGTQSFSVYCHVHSQQKTGKWKGREGSHHRLNGHTRTPREAPKILPSKKGT